MKRHPLVCAFNAALRIIDRANAVLLTFLVGLLASGVILSVFLRYVFGISFAWAEESLANCFIGTTFFGAALGIRESEHIAIHQFQELAPPGLRKALQILAMLAVAAVSGVVFAYSLSWIRKVGAVPSPATGIASGVFYLIVPVSCAMTVFYAFVAILAHLVGVDAPTTKSRFETPMVSPGSGENTP